MPRVSIPLSLLPAAGWLWLAGLCLLGILGAEPRRHHFEGAGLAFGAGLVVFAWVRARRATVATSPRDHGPPPAQVYAVPAIAAAMAFAWSVRLGPLSDDFVLRAWAVAGDWTPEGWPFLRPVPLALWQAIFAAGLSWPALHALNVLVHVLNSALVGYIGHRWLGPRAGLAAGLLFAAFPASTEAVAWSAGIFDLVATACVLAAIALVLRGPSTAHRIAGLVLICLAGLLSKESAIAIPALLLLSMMMERQSRGTRVRIVPVAVALALAAAFAAGRLAVSPAAAGHLGNVPLESRHLKDLLLRPFAGLAVPFRTSEGIGTDAFVAALAVLILIAITVVRVARTRGGGAASGDAAALAPALLFGAGWILASSFWLLRQFYVSPLLEGSRYLYLPCVGFAIAAGAALAGRPSGRFVRTGAGALVVLLGLYGARLHSERRVWLEAAATRETVLSHVAGMAKSRACRTVSVEGAPDSREGVYVFREGLAEALAGVPATPWGPACAFRWTGAALVSLPDDASGPRGP